ncbi:MAG: DUF488 domain-containing protein [Nitrospiraceae bacterium]|nr:DUF488 domain-containing protein [Nitrospiraceae bacterium]
MEPVSVFTIGYEKSTIDEFISRLRRHNITVLVDVREIPASRKPGFSKSRLAETLENHNITYIHVKELGSPKSLRTKLHQNNDYESFFDEYSAYIDSQLEIVKELYEEIVSQETSCLMCMERFPEYCHRRVVADKIKEIDGNGLRIMHI